MEKTLRYFTDDAITMFKNNQEDFCQKMRENPNNIDWVDEFYGTKASIPSNYKFDFAFKSYDKNSICEDYDNAVAMFELFKKYNIGPATIYNEKFLTGFIFTFGYEYFMNVIGADQTSHVFCTLFFGDGTRRALARNTIGRLYRYVELTYDDSLADPYELTKFAFQNKNLLRIRYYTYVDGKNTCRAFFRAFKEWYEENRKEIKLSLVNKVGTHLSMIANVSDTDLMDQRDLINSLKTYINRVDLGLE